MYFILIIWLLSYVTGIVKTGLSLYRHRKCTAYLTDFIAIYGQGQEYFRPRQAEYKDELTALIKNAPYIEELVDYPKLSYSDSDEETYRKAWRIFTELQMRNNKARISFHRAFVPFFSLLEIIFFPIALLKKMDFSLSKNTALILDILFWISTYFLDMFQPEIKQLIISFLQ